MKRELTAIICQHIFDDTHPVLLVCRAGGDWQFLCGADHPDGTRPRVVGINHIFDRDPTLRALADLPPEWEAERSKVGDPWARRPVSDNVG